METPISLLTEIAIDLKINLEQALFVIMFASDEQNKPFTSGGLYLINKYESFDSDHILDNIITPLTEKEILMVRPAYTDKAEAMKKWYEACYLNDELYDKFFTANMGEEFWNAYPRLFPIGAGSFIARTGDKERIIQMYLKAIGHSKKKHKQILIAVDIYKRKVDESKINGSKIFDFVQSKTWELFEDEIELEAQKIERDKIHGRSSTKRGATRFI